MSDSPLQLERLTDVGFVNIRGNSQDAEFTDAIRDLCGMDVPTTPNTVSGDTLHLYWLGPDEWLLAGEAGKVAEVARDLAAKLGDQHAAVNDLSGGQVVYRLLGDAARDLLAKGCTLDLHPRIFGVGQCAQTGLAKSGVLLRPLPDGASFEIIVRRSFADYVWQWLLHAGREFRIEVV